MNPLISIITPVHNSENYIEECINSVKEQTYTNFEMIIVDDFSNDQSVSIIKKNIKNDNRFNLVELKENKGAANSKK
ncbi:MAG: glycosyltransferase family 2 protein [Chitinophagales bacterium]